MMRWLEVRRHSLTKKDSARGRGSHLSEVDHHEQWRWPRPYRSYAELLGRGGGLADVAEDYRRIWKFHRVAP
jgi:hypothetical protein